MDRLLLDLRLAVRRLRQNPLFAVVAILSLAIGIGANVTVFSAFNAILFQPPAGIERPDRLVFLNNGKGRFAPNHSFPNYLDIRDRNQALAGTIAYRFAPVSLTTPSGSTRLWAYLATGNYFDVLGVRPVIGRTLTPADDIKGGPQPVAVLSYAAWQRHFGGAGDIAGRRVKVNGLDYSIVGVAPRGFQGTELFFTPDLWVPMHMQAQIEGSNDWLYNRRSFNAFVMGRLRDGVSAGGAEASLNTVADQLAREYPRANEGMRIYLSPPGLAGSMIRTPLLGFAGALLFVAGLVLLVACANLASLMVVRATDRARETAIQMALGADRRHLIRQLLSETGVLAALGAAGGVLLALWLTDLFTAWRPLTDFPLGLALRVNGSVLAFSALLTIGTVLAAGLGPALSATRGDLIQGLKREAGERGGRRWRLRDILVAAQVSLSVILLSGAILVSRGLGEMSRVPLGFRAENAAMVSFDLGIQGYSEEQGRDFHQRVLERVRALPGVQSAALASTIPLAMNRSNNEIVIEGQPPRKAADRAIAVWYEVSDGYFETLQTQLLAGRPLEARDAARRQAAVVNRAFADQFLPGVEPLGKRFSVGGRWIEIVGVVETGKHGSLIEAPSPAVFVPFGAYRAGVTLVARSSQPPAVLLRALDQAIRELDPAVATYGKMSLEEHLSFPLLPARLSAGTLASFGSVAILLAAIGVSGLVAYSVARRTREIGIRTALGATSADILSAILRRTLWLVGVGTAVGVAGSLGVNLLLSRLAFGMSPRDPWTLLATVLGMATVAVAACLAPARRALRVDPMTALREQ